MPSDFLDSNEFAALAGISRTTPPAWRLRKTGPTFYRVGRRVSYRRDDIERWLECRRVDPGSPSREIVNSASKAQLALFGDPSPPDDGGAE